MMNLQRLTGNWVEGFAYSFHSTSSRYLGHNKHGRDHYAIERTVMGDLVYRLKYQQDVDTINQIVNLLLDIQGLNCMDMIVPIPPSNKNRLFQPVFEVAKGLATRLGISAEFGLLSKTYQCTEAKKLAPTLRARYVKQTMHIVNARDLTGRNILLFDDLYETGATLQAAATLLKQHCGTPNIYVLTLTKTRKHHG
jgi:predicted amidophosphoribosyltransferase